MGDIQRESPKKAVKAPGNRHCKTKISAIASFLKWKCNHKCKDQKVPKMGKKSCLEIQTKCRWPPKWAVGTQSVNWASTADSRGWNWQEGTLEGKREENTRGERKEQKNREDAAGFWNLVLDLKGTLVEKKSGVNWFASLHSISFSFALTHSKNNVEITWSYY